MSLCCWIYFNGECLSLPVHVEQCQALPCWGKKALLWFQQSLSWLKGVSLAPKCLGRESAPAHSLLTAACHMKTDFRGIGKLWGRCILEESYPFTLPSLREVKMSSLGSTLHSKQNCVNSRMWLYTFSKDSASLRVKYLVQTDRCESHATCMSTTKPFQVPCGRAFSRTFALCPR